LDQAPRIALGVRGSGHDLAGRAVPELGDLRTEHWLAFPQRPERREAQAETIFAQFLIRDVPDIRWTPVDSLSAQKRLIEAGFGISLMPESSVAEERAAKNLDIITVEDLDIAVPISTIMREDGYLSAASIGLLKYLTTG
jgi:DNA-binding transcriptional LysR family regulator